MEQFKKIVRKTEEGFDKIKFVVKDKLNLFDPVIIYPYRGIGDESTAYLHGRILEKEGIIHDKTEMEDTLWNNIHKAWKRYESDEVPGVELEGTLEGVKGIATSDKEGYFTIAFEGLKEKNLKNGWHDVQLRITHMPFDLEYEETAMGEVFIQKEKAEFGIISDVDDTIIKSYAMDPIKRVTTMLKDDAKTRVPFKNVDKLYNYLVGDGRNPLMFVSGSSYNLYDMLTSFCEYNDIPKAPFFLRDLGLDTKQWIKQDAKPYKTNHIERIFKIYEKLSFVMIGDSGQEDPEIYTSILKKHPDRVMAIIIRHVHTDERKEELDKMAESLEIPFLVIDDSQDAIDFVKKKGWVKSDTVA